MKNKRGGRRGIYRPAVRCPLGIILVSPTNFSDMYVCPFDTCQASGCPRHSASKMPNTPSSRTLKSRKPRLQDSPILSPRYASDWEPSLPSLESFTPMEEHTFTPSWILDENSAADPQQYLIAQDDIQTSSEWAEPLGGPSSMSPRMGTLSRDRANRRPLREILAEVENKENQAPGERLFSQKHVTTFSSSSGFINQDPWSALTSLLLGMPIGGTNLYASRITIQMNSDSTWTVTQYS